MSIVSSQPRKVNYQEAVKAYVESIAPLEAKEITYAASPLKWIGGKSKMISEFEEYYPGKDSKICCEVERSAFNLLNMLNNNYNDTIEPVEKMKGIKCFIEPFLGGATNSIFIAQKYPSVEQFYGTDALNDLVNFYLVIQFYKGEFLETFNQLANNYNTLCKSDKDKEVYFSDVRLWYNRMSIPLCSELDGVSIERAAGFYFLHLTSFNNQYRVNAKGMFNTPPGKAKECILPEESIKVLDNLLKKMYVAHEDYKKSLNFVKHLINPAEDVEGFESSTEEEPYAPDEIFVYLDPPASPHTLPSSAVNAGVDMFSPASKNMRDLAEYCNNLTELGVKWLMTIEDSDCLKYFEESYKGKFNKKDVLNKGVRNPSKKIKEVFIYNYELMEE